MRGNAERQRILRVKFENDGSGRVAILIEDTGAGIDRKNIARIFEAFFTTKPNGMG